MEEFFVSSVSLEGKPEVKWISSWNMEKEAKIKKKLRNKENEGDLFLIKNWTISKGGKMKKKKARKIIYEIWRIRTMRYVKL